METATYLLFVLGILGALDILIFHSFAHGIRSHPDCRWELIPHSLRGPTYAALFVLIPNFEPYGAWFWALLGLFALDVGISVWDFALERRSRAFLGGLPSGEYVLHMVMAMLFGALVTTVIFESGAWRSLPTDLVYSPDAVADWLRWLLGGMAAIVLISGLQDAVAAVRLWSRPPQHPPRGSTLYGRSDTNALSYRT